MQILKCGCGGRRKKKGCKGPNCPPANPEPVVQTAQESQQSGQ